jgi:hypothetical protein
MPRLIADATVVIDPHNAKAYPSTNTNHVEHLGTSGLADRRILDEIIDLYRSSGVSRFFVYVSPSPQAAELEGWLQSAGMEKTVELSVFWRTTEGLEQPATPFDLRVCREADGDKLRQVVNAEGDPFFSNAGTVDMLGTPGFHAFLACLEDRPAAMGSLYIQKDLGYLGNGKTLEPYRRQGAQSAIIAARVALAAERGCTDVVGETYWFLESSYRNLCRAGFTELYTRPIYRWEAEPSSA